MRCLSLPARGILALSALVAARACCDDYKLRVGKLRNQMDFGFDVAADVDFDWDMQFDFKGDWAAWAGIWAATDVNLNFDWDGTHTFKTRTSGDVDDDGVAEKVSLLALAEGEPSDPDRVFAAWKGDKYSFDQGTCYLLWWDGNRLELLSSRCEKAEPALYCVMNRGDKGSLSCDVCSANGACMQCSTDESVADCVSMGERELPEEPRPSNAQGGNAAVTAAAGSGGAGEHAGGSPAIAGAGGADAGIAGVDQARAGAAPAGGGASGGAPNSGTGGSSGQQAGISVSAEWSLCVEQVDSITREARDCDMAEPLDDQTLCSERLTDVNVCYLAVQAAGVFTSPCGVLDENLTCGRLFP